ncbi:hypothetical protein M513_02250 [Trichuris suis]|uniref:Uncharacterized protein n=1 Tax=Trichuris suis TaxID=68888 RepID=A0A085MIE7_9BILA|nr:hypothetical protein M513_02250 [Trichuris suis]
MNSSICDGNLSGRLINLLKDSGFRHGISGPDSVFILFTPIQYFIISKRTKDAHADANMKGQGKVANDLKCRNSHCDQ